MKSKRRACPICDRGPKDKAMNVTTDERGVVMYCHRCGYTSANNHRSAPAAPRSFQSWIGRAAYLWGASEPLAGSPAEAYLKSRNLRLPPAGGDLRFLPAHREHAAAMVARVTDAITAEPISLHFTRLTADGKKLGNDAKRLLAGHRKTGGVIRLWPNEAVTTGLGIAEGIESSLAAAWGYQPMWACIDAGNMATLPVLAGIQTLLVFADHDDAGLRAAYACGERWAESASLVKIVKSDKPGQDLADVVAP